MEVPDYINLAVAIILKCLPPIRINYFSSLWQFIKRIVSVFKRKPKVDQIQVLTETIERNSQQNSQQLEVLCKISERMLGKLEEIECGSAQTEIQPLDIESALQRLQERTEYLYERSKSIHN